MDECHNPGIRVFLQGVFQGIRIDRFSPGTFHNDRGGFATLDIFDHASAKNAVATDDDLVSRGYHVDETALHADGTRTGDRVGQLVVCLEGVP